MSSSATAIGAVGTAVLMGTIREMTGSNLATILLTSAIGCALCKIGELYNSKKISEVGNTIISDCSRAAPAISIGSTCDPFFANSEAAKETTLRMVTHAMHKGVDAVAKAITARAA